MGGIVGAETLLLLASEQPLPLPPNLQKSSDNITTATTDGHPEEGAASMGRSSASMNSYHLMFPHIQGLFAFDTPFLGIAPGVVSHGAEEHYKTASTAYSAMSEVAGIFGYGNPKNDSASAIPSSARTKSTTPLALPPATSDAAATPSWQRWGRYAMFAGAAGAVAAGGAAALYSQKGRFTAGWSWVSSHLEFVGCLARPEDLRNRVASLSELRRERGINSMNFYTCLGKGATPINGSADGLESGRRSSSLILRVPRSQTRTFCHLPEDYDHEDSMITTDSGLKWVKALNDKAPDETTAHVSIFLPRDNPAYYKLAHDAAETLVSWIDQGWYESATPRPSSSISEQPGQKRQQPAPPEPQQASKKNVPTAEELERSQEAEDHGFMEAEDVVVID